jgi:hypothetical protein
MCVKVAKVQWVLTWFSQLFQQMVLFPEAVMLQNLAYNFVVMMFTTMNFAHFLQSPA